MERFRVRSLVRTKQDSVNLEYVVKFSLLEYETVFGPSINYVLHLSSGDPNNSKVTVNKEAEPEAFQVIEDWVSGHTVRPRPIIEQPEEEENYE